VSDALLPVYPRLALDLLRASGCWLHTRDGREILDLYGGHAVTPLGHCHPELHRTLVEGHSTLDFYSNSLEMAVQQSAARALLGQSAHLTRVHFVNSGAEANEAALHLARRQTGRSKVLSFDCAFHGRTLACLAATGLAGYRDRLSLPVDQHNDFLRFGELEDLAQIDQQTAAVICESVPSLAGVWMPPQDYYPALAARCREVGALLIFDEIQGGIGRLGQWFAHTLFDVEPDMVTLAKGLASGYPAGALLTTEAVSQQVSFGELGTTFGGGPLACRMIERTAQLIRGDGLLPRVVQIHQQIRAGLPDVQLRGAGCLIGIQTALPARELRDRLLARDIMVGVSAEPQTIRLLPPYILADSEIELFCSAFREAIDA